MLLEHAQDKQEADLKQSTARHEAATRLLLTQSQQRKTKIRVLKRILLDTVPSGASA